MTRNVPGSDASPHETPGNLGIFDGFEGFRTRSPEQQRHALQNALVAIDANVLLNLYRYTDATRNDLLEVFRRIGDRLWIPHQSMREFWRNRLAAMGNHASVARQTRDGLERQRDNVVDALRKWAVQIGLGEPELDELNLAANELFDRLGKAVIERQQSPDGSSLSTYSDAIVSRLEVLLAGKVGRPLEKDEWNRCVAEGKRRIEARVPPGYMDAAKDEGNLPEAAAGDYLVWYQSIKESVRQDRDLLLVTGDEKEDWWWRRRAEFIGPRVELVTEFREKCGRDLFMMRPADLLTLADALEVTVRPESVGDAERVGEAKVDQPLWTPRGIAELLRRLEFEGWEQAEVIRVAADRGGVIDRESVYEIGQYDEDRMLRGFTRPSARITRDLQNEGIVDDGVRPMLEPLYIGVKASGFRVPDEVVDIIGKQGSKGAE